MPVERSTVFTEVEGILRSVLGDFGPDVEITSESSFRDDLEMESIDVVALAGRLQARYPQVNFAQFVAGLDVSSMAELRVGQLVDHITSVLEEAPTSGAVRP